MKAIPQLKYILLLTIGMGCAGLLHAQEEGLPPDDGDPINTPIDGGVSLLIAAGVAYGVKQAHAHRKGKKENEK